MLAILHLLFVHFTHTRGGRGKDKNGDDETGDRSHKGFFFKPRAPWTPYFELEKSTRSGSSSDNVQRVQQQKKESRKRHGGWRTLRHTFVKGAKIRDTPNKDAWTDWKPHEFFFSSHFVLRLDEAFTFSSCVGKVASFFFCSPSISPHAGHANRVVPKPFAPLGCGAHFLPCDFRCRRC